MGNIKEGNVLVKVSISEEIYKALKYASFDEGRRIGEIVEEAVLQYLKKNKEEDKD
jgi:hypothetical protein